MIIICQGIRDQNNSKSDNNKRDSSRYTFRKLTHSANTFPRFNRATMMINDDNYFRYRVETSYWTSANSSRSVGILPTFVNINECAGNLITKVYYTERSRGGGGRGGMFGEISRTGEDRLNVKGENERIGYGRSS